MTIKRATLAILSLVLILGLAGCSSPVPTTPSNPTTGSYGKDAPKPTIEIVTPVDGDALPAGDVSVKVETTDLEFVMPGNTNVAGQGHVHFTLDGKPEQMSPTPDYTFKDVAAGSHELRAELVQNNTEKFDPPVFAEISFEVK